MKYNYYNFPSRIVLLIISIGPFLGMGIYFLLQGIGFAKVLSVLLFFLFAVFFYKAFFMNVIIDEEGVKYQSLFRKQSFEWAELHDVLIVVRQRRSVPDFYKLNEWFDAGYSGKSYFLLFRTTDAFPENPMFMFSAPMSYHYISVQYRKGMEKIIREKLK
ncbi:MULTISPECIES: PH domain-containing protein [Myroides]|uniref:PH domain-containing protein n=1 Tax=Myroides albus TaxID=2562892 RepID=A0A6I3LGE3_9FLAO|nr:MULTISPECIES: PH domain-containing protein [Myroides]MTG96957.1 PH domain-containing protein [Myroides albus]MVX35350.1 PH domain-containing protein [Myroides sp. LoEW2-1]UVD78291.1 PH domain-containing protein [Myroides albus]